MRNKSVGCVRNPYLLLRTFVASVLLMASFLATPLAVAAAQGSSQEVGPLSSQSDAGDTSYVSELTDQELTWSDDWELVADAIVSDGLETFSIETTDGTFFVSYVEGEADLEEGLEAYLGGFTEAFGTGENVDAGEAGESWYSLDAVEDTDLQLSVFSVIVQLDGFLRVDTILAEPDLLGDLFDEAKSSIERDGDEIYPGIETVTDTKIELVVEDADATSTPDDEDVTPDDEDVTPEDEDVTPEDEDVTPEDEDVTPEDEDVTPEDEELNEDWFDAGLISATEYESPQFGYTVEWTEPWELDVYYDDPDNGTGTVVTEDGDLNADTMHIWIQDLDTILRIQTFENTSALTTNDYLDFWESKDYLEGFSSEATSLSVEGDDEIAASIYYLETGYIGYNQITLLDDGETLQFLFFLAPAENFEEAFELAQDDIEIDGAGSFDVYSKADLDDVIADYLP